MRSKIGFIGLGNMGKPMAMHLHASGAEIHIHNRSQAVIDALAGKGLITQKSPADIAKAVGDGIIFICATNSEATEQILTAKEPAGLLSQIHPGSLVIDMGSNRVDETKKWASQVREHGSDWLDSPVSGGQLGAEAASLSIMCGGTSDAFERARPVLAQLGKSVLHMGPTGAGQVAKLANQIIVAIEIAAVSEAYTLAASHGVDLSQLREALLGGFASSRILELQGQRMIDNSFEPGGTATNQLKDVVEASRVAELAGLDLPLLKANSDIWQSMIDSGLGHLDHSGLFAFYQSENESNR